MNTLKGRIVTLEALKENHLEQLIKIRNSDDFLKYCTGKRNKVSLAEFRSEIARDFDHDRYEQYVIWSRFEIVGTIYVYGLRKTDGYAFITTYLDSSVRSSLVGFESFIIVLVNLFTTVPCLNKVYTDIYEYNHLSLKPLLRGGFVEEGLFKEHRLWNGKRWNVHRLAFYRRQLKSIYKFIKRVT